MDHNTPVSPLPLSRLAQQRQCVLSGAQLRAHGVTAAAARDRCRPGGGWQELLPGVFLLHPAPPTGVERLHAALLYARRPPAPGEPSGAARRTERAPGPEPVITGLAALALRGFASVPALAALEHVDVLVPRTRRLRSVSFAHLVRCARPPAPQRVTGVPVAPVARAVADAAARLADASAVRGVLAEAVYGGHGGLAGILAELDGAGLLDEARVAAGAVDALLAGDRSLTEGLLYRTVHENGLPVPLWNVDLRLPGGPCLGTFDAYWPDESVAVELEGGEDATPAPGAGERALGGSGRALDEDVSWAAFARRHELLDRLGITVVRLSPRALCTAARRSAAVVRTALAASADRVPAAHVRVLPR